MAISTRDVVPLSQARANFSELADQVKEGAEKIITKNGESYVALIDARRLDHYHQLPVRSQDPLGSTKPTTVLPLFHSLRSSQQRSRGNEQEC